MKEEFLQYLWKYKLFNNSKLQTSNNDRIEVLNQGTHNFDSGPDFFNAKIEINDTVWAGNVEVHLKSSDWDLHNHQHDKAYDNVILQVVNQHDKQVFASNGRLIPTIELTFNQNIWDNYEAMISRDSWISCEEDLKMVDTFTIQTWLEKLAIERLEEKAIKIDQLLKLYHNSWEEAFYILLARNFGFKLNAEPFEQLARSLPLKYLARHKDNIIQLEALLFGQAGFLEEEYQDDYYNQLNMNIII